MRHAWVSRVGIITLVGGFCLVGYGLGGTPAAAVQPGERMQISPPIWRVVRASKSRLHGIEGIGPGIKGDEAIAIRHHKTCVHHAKRAENSRLNEGIEALAADHFDETRQDVDGHRVLP